MLHANEFKQFCAFEGLNEYKNKKFAKVKTRVAR